jgi:DNA-binding MarR family transcriptional regulator
MRMDGPAPTTGSLLWHLALRWRTEVDRAVARFGLTHAQYSVLASLDALAAQGRRPSQSELAAYTGLQVVYVSKLVRALEDRALITRVSDAADARANRLDLTAAGQGTIARAREVVRALDARLTAPIGGPGGPRTADLHAALRLLLDQTETSP